MVEVRNLAGGRATLFEYGANQSQTPGFQQDFHRKAQIEQMKRRCLEPDKVCNFPAVPQSKPDPSIFASISGVHPNRTLRYSWVQASQRKRRKRRSQAQRKPAGRNSGNIGMWSTGVPKMGVCLLGKGLQNSHTFMLLALGARSRQSEGAVAAGCSSQRIPRGGTLQAATTYLHSCKLARNKQIK